MHPLKQVIVYNRAVSLVGQKICPVWPWILDPFIKAVYLYFTGINWGTKSGAGNLFFFFLLSLIITLAGSSKSHSTGLVM